MAGPSSYMGNREHPVTCGRSVVQPPSHGKVAIAEGLETMGSTAQESLTSQISDRSGGAGLGSCCLGARQSLDTAVEDRVIWQSSESQWAQQADRECERVAKRQEQSLEGERKEGGRTETRDYMGEDRCNWN